MEQTLAEPVRLNLLAAAKKIVAAKQRGGKVVVVTGSGPNLHEGVTTLIAELMHKGVIDGVITSSAVVAHEMAGTLDRVKRVAARTSAPDLATARHLLPRGGLFEITLLTDAQAARSRRRWKPGGTSYDRIAALPGSDHSSRLPATCRGPWALEPKRLAREAEQIARSRAVCCSSALSGLARTL